MRSAIGLLPLVLACGPSSRPAPTPQPSTVDPPALGSSHAERPPRKADANPTVLDDAQRKRAAARTPLASALVEAFTNEAPVFARDGKRFLFTSNRGGSPQLYLADASKPKNPPIAITTGPERTGWADFTRDGKAILFLRDEGADENFAIFKVGLDGKQLENLTPSAKLHRDQPFEPKNKPGTLIYTQHDPKSPASELVIHPLAGKPAVVYTDPSPANVADVTADGTRAVVLRWLSASEVVMLEVELASGKARRVFPAEGKQFAINDARYSPDGKLLYVSSDDGATGQYLYAVDPGSGTVKANYKQDAPATAFISTLNVSPKGDRIAINVNAGNHSEIRILDAKTLALRTKVKSPLGSIEITRFSDDSKRFGLTISSPESPTDVFAADTANGAVAALRKEPRNGLRRLPSIATSIETVKAFDGLVIPINTYLPRQEAGRVPVIVAFHGGPAWSYQMRWSAQSRFFTSIGYAYVEPNVRGSTGFGRAYEEADNREKRADWLKDLETVNAWVKAQGWADPQRVVVFGGSYGGYTVLMALTRQPKLWRAGVNLFGVADLVTFLKSTDQAIRAAFVAEFGDLDRDKELLAKFSPMRDVANITAPLFVYAGANDPRVPRSESDLIVSALRERGVPSEYMVSDNEGHSLDRRENQIEFFTRVARFLDEQFATR